MPQFLAPWETATDVTPAIQKGLLPQAATSPLTAFCALALMLFLWTPLGIAAIPIALIFARLIALDLTTYTLPNIYTVPLIAVGLMHAFTNDQLSQALIAILLLVFFSRTLYRANLRGLSMGFGGGDLKLLAALFAFLPLTSAFWAIAVGSLLWMPIAFAKPKAMVPFGVPLILGWTILLCLPDLPNWLFSTIS
jgi:prepilin signal peptidase PulO-like enzyme (type II secretory pathway)